MNDLEKRVKAIEERNARVELSTSPNPQHLAE